MFAVCRSFFPVLALLLAAIILSHVAPVQAASEKERTLAAQLLAAVPPRGERSLGRHDAPVVIVEYASATCPHCAEFHMNVLPELKKTYIDTGKARYIFREFPLDQRALAVFMLLHCVPEDKFFPVLEVVFRRQKLWNGDKVRTELLKIMRFSGLQEPEFDACLKRDDLAKAIYETGKTANESFGVKGTPTIFVNGMSIDGHEEPSAVFGAIESELAAE